MCSIKKNPLKSLAKFIGRKTCVGMKDLFFTVLSTALPKHNAIDAPPPPPPSPCAT